MILPRQELSLLMRGSWQQLGGALGLSLVSSALDVVCLIALPAFLMVALSPAGAVPPTWLGLELPALALPWLTTGIVALFLFRALFMLGVGAALMALAESVRKRVVSRLVEQFVATPYENAIDRSLAQSLTATIGHSYLFASNVVLPLLRLILDLLTIVAVLGFIALIAPRVVLAMVVVLLLVAGLYYLSIRRISDEQATRVSNLETELTHEVMQTLGAPREVRIFQLGGYFVNRVQRILGARIRAKAWLGAVYWFPRSLGELTLIGLGIAYMVVNTRAGHETAYVISNLSALAFAGVRLLPAFAQCMASLSFMRSGRHAMLHLAANLGRADPAATPPEPRPAGGGSFSSVELRNVSYAYPNDARGALSEVSLTIRRGQSVGVVGPSGAGKSTLADVVLGLLTPTRGEVRVNDQPLAAPARDWWARVGFVPQNPYLANDTLRRNIAFGEADDRIDPARLELAARLASLEGVVARLPQGYDTPLGEGGVRLSGGQRQRVAIARALYRQREFLVLDEATSALDAETEADVIKAIEALKGTVTTLIIAHRTSTLVGCDFIVRMKDGRIDTGSA